MTFDPLKPGGYSTGERLTSAQMNQLNDDIQNALDGAAGGSYDPSAAIVIGGAGLETSVTPSSGDDVTNKTYVDAQVATKVTPASARYRITNSSVNPVTFSSATSGVLTSTGFSLEDSGQSIQVPAAGRYLVSWALYTRTTSTANPVGMQGSLRVGGVAYQTKDGSRWNATASDLIIMADTALVEIATPASERLSLVVSAFDGTPSILNESTPGTHWLSVARVS